MPFCGDCGEEHQGSKFCPNCGAPQQAGAAPQQANTTPQPTSVAAEVHTPPPMDEDETTVWEDSSKDMMSAASSGRLTSCRYRLTNKSIYFDEGLLSSNAQQVPLWAVRDVDVKQGMIQKARGVGDVIVHVEHSDYTGRNVIHIKDVEGPQTVRDQLNKYASKERREHDQRLRTQWYGRGQ